MDFQKNGDYGGDTPTYMRGRYSVDPNIRPEQSRPDHFRVVIYVASSVRSLF